MESSPTTVKSKTNTSQESNSQVKLTLKLSFSLSHLRSREVKLLLKLLKSLAVLLKKPHSGELWSATRNNQTRYTHQPTAHLCWLDSQLMKTRYLWFQKRLHFNGMPVATSPPMTDKSLSWMLRKYHKWRKNTREGWLISQIHHLSWNNPLSHSKPSTHMK